MNAARDPADLPPDVVQLVLDYADSVPHLEALQLVWEGGDKAWTADAVAARLYIEERAAAAILRDLHRKGLLDAAKDTFARPRNPVARDVAIKLVNAYRRNLAAVARLIHSRPPASLREFARAFKLKDDS